MQQGNLDSQCINTIRFLSADAVQQANSGHPGAPMGMATMAYVLWNQFLKHSPSQPDWPDRDRFVLSAGHASMLLYSLLHLSGYDLTLDDIRDFRQWGSRTPGHPERGEAPGVEMTTGPLGQGFAHGVGMAIAETHLAARFNRPGHSIINHHTYAIISDGDLQEGLSSEAASLAGTLKLGKLIYLYDSNDIQIEGSTETVFTEDVAARFTAYGWQVIGPIDGFDTDAVSNSLKNAKANTDQPTLIILKTVIGFGSPRAGTAKAHGEPLGEENLIASKKELGWPLEPTFHVPDEVQAHMYSAVERGAQLEEDWNTRCAAYMQQHPELAEELRQRLAGELPDDWNTELESLFPSGSKPIATRAASGKVLNTIAPVVTGLIGGSADLAPSNKTHLDGEEFFSAEHPGGRNMQFGVREHAMAAIAGGMALHGGTIPYVGTFLTFSDYMRPAMRLAALMELRVVYVFTHDSIGLGEDGPTHQPVEHLMALRAIPNLTVIRPADATETTVAWNAALVNPTGPTALILTRQNLPVLDRSQFPPMREAEHGACTLWQSTEGDPDLILIASGSEVDLALRAGQELTETGITVRVVSMCSWELFAAESGDYQNSILPPLCRARVAIEAGITQGWEKYVGLDGAVIGLDRFGASAPAEILFEEFGFTVEHVVAIARDVLAHCGTELVSQLGS
jgi:transketolase